MTVLVAGLVAPSGLRGAADDRKAVEGPAPLGAEDASVVRVDGPADVGAVGPTTPGTAAVGVAVAATALGVPDEGRAAARAASRRVAGRAGGRPRVPTATSRAGLLTAVRLAQVGDYLRIIHTYWR